MKSLFLIFLALLLTQSLFGQNVGIGTLNPDASAALHINSNNKGVLFPKVSLQNGIDDITVPNPAAGLVVFNTNSNFSSGEGLFYNAGTADAPNWQPVASLKLPYTGSVGSNNVLFNIENFGNGDAMSGIANKGIGTSGVSNTGTGVFAKSFSANALEVEGKVKISGNGQIPGGGKVLTSDANGNATWEGAVAFSAVGVVGGGSEKMEKDVYTKIPFANVDYDLGNNYKNATDSPHSTFIAPVNGIYHFDVYVSSTPNVGTGTRTELLLARNRNGSEVIIRNSDVTNLTVRGLNFISLDCQLQQGDQVYLLFHFFAQDYINLLLDAQSASFSGRLVIKD